MRRAFAILTLGLTLLQVAPARADDASFWFRRPITGQIDCMISLAQYMWICPSLAAPGWVERYGGPLWRATDLRAAFPDYDRDGSADLVLRIAPDPTCRDPACTYLIVFHDQAGRGARRGLTMTSHAVPLPARWPGRAGLRFGSNGAFWGVGQLKARATAGAPKGEE